MRNTCLYWTTRRVEQLERQKENIERTTEAQLKVSAQLHMELSQANHELTELRRETADAREEKEDALQTAAMAKKEAKEAEAIKEESQKKADSLKAYIRTFERNVREYDDAKKWQLPEPDFLMTAAGYREKKALPLVNKLKNVIKNLTLQLIHALEANDRLKQNLEKSNQKVDHLLNRVSKLEERNNILDELSMKHIAIITGNSVIGLLKPIIPGNVIMRFLPGSRLFQCHTWYPHGIACEVESNSYEQD